jgi:hypothetical protein
MFWASRLVFPAIYGYNVKGLRDQFWKGWCFLRTKMLSRFFSFCIAALISCIPALPAAARELPVCAQVAGTYLQAERAEGGARLLSSYLNSFTTVTARPYTDTSRSKLYIFQTIVSTPYAGNAPFNPYFEEVTQIAPYTFTDRKGIEYVFDITEDGRVSQLCIDGVRWIPSAGLISPASINLTILLLQLLCLYSCVAVLITVLRFFQNRRRRWKSLPATRLNTALTLTQAAALIANAVLLIRAVPTLPYESLSPFFLLNGLFLLALPALSAGVLLTARKSELEPCQKIAYAVNVACALLLFALLALWQLYR